MFTLLFLGDVYNYKTTMILICIKGENTFVIWSAVIFFYCCDSETFVWVKNSIIAKKEGKS